MILNCRMLSLMSTVALCIPIHAQISSSSPDASHGSTLTVGAHQEVFTQDSVMRIGSFRYSTVTGRAYDVGQATDHQDLQDAPAIGVHRTGRFLTIDPYFHKYAAISPYAFVGNSPLVAIDPDGKEINIVHNGRTRTYYIGMKPGIFTSRKVRQTIAMLNDIAKEKGAAFEEVVAPGHTLNLMLDGGVRLKKNNTAEFWRFFGAADNAQAPGANNVIYVDPTRAMMELDADGNVLSTTSPTASLSHEIGHFFYDILHPELKNNPEDSKNHDQIIPEWEQPVQEAMNEQGDEGKIRTPETEAKSEKGGRGYNYRAVSPRSTKPNERTRTGRKAKALLEKL
jgi:hypothetical protein